MTQILYLSRTGMLEPLGQSQVLAYLRGLSLDYSVTLISFEREADLADYEHLAQIEAICAAHGIRWVRLRYRQRPRIIASAWNLGMLVYRAWLEAKRDSPNIIHARSYVPAAAAWFVWRFSGIPYIFDMRSLWPEELITSARLRRASLLHKVIFGAERRLLADAGFIVSLTRAGVRYLERVHPGSLSADRLRVMPTCTDLARFCPAPDAQSSGPLIGCHGSLTNGWFRIDLLARIFDHLAVRMPTARFEIITREDPEKVRTALDASLGGAPSWCTRLTISSAKASDIHKRIQRQNLSVFFYATGAASEFGRSPTRMGESLACGVPVMANEGIGDVAEIIRDGNVGYVLDGEDEAALSRAADAVVALLASRNISERCRQVAERVYSLESGIEGYREIYRHLASVDTPVRAGIKKSGFGK
jgi:glycosyltransferase involved in cell wall biosynthesis